MAAVNPPLALQAAAPKHPAQLFRQALSTLISPAGGLVAAGGLLVTQKGTPDMHVLIGGGTPAEGAAWVPGNVSPGTQGLYYCWNNASFELVIPASDATNPRVETIVARVKDSQYEGAEDTWALEALKGTATAGATLANKTGAATLTKNSLVLAYVLVPAKATTVVTANIENVATQFTVAGRALLSSGGAYSALKAYTSEKEEEASATRAALVVLSCSGGNIQNVTVGGVVLGPSLIAGVTYVSFICPPGVKWKAKTSGTSEYSYLLL